MSLPERLRLPLFLLCLLALSNAHRKVSTNVDDTTLVADDDDELLEMSVGTRQSIAGQYGQHSAFITDENR